MLTIEPALRRIRGSGLGAEEDALGVTSMPWSHAAAVVARAGCPANPRIVHEHVEPAEAPHRRWPRTLPVPPRSSRRRRRRTASPPLPVISASTPLPSTSRISPSTRGHPPARTGIASGRAHPAGPRRLIKATFPASLIWCRRADRPSRPGPGRVAVVRFRGCRWPRCRPATSGCSRWKCSSPSGRSGGRRTGSSAGAVAFTGGLAATAGCRWPSMGSSTTASRSAISCGTLK